MTNVPHSASRGGLNLFIANLATDVTEADLLQAFGLYGAIDSVKVMRNNGTGDSRGYGFALFRDPVCGNAAMQALHGSSIKGRMIFVSAAQSHAHGQGKRPPALQAQRVAAPEHHVVIPQPAAQPPVMHPYFQAPHPTTQAAPYAIFVPAYDVPPSTAVYQHHLPNTYPTTPIYSFPPATYFARDH
jgi:RNA recognition motif-containing protein